MPSRDEFLAEVAAGKFLECQEILGQMYGTHSHQLDHPGKICLLDLDVKGALEIAKKVSCNFIFIKTPSLDDISIRMKNKGTDSEI